MELPDSYYDQLAREYAQRRDVMMGVLEEAGFIATPPEGAYYVLADYTHIDAPQAAWDCERFARWLTTDVVWRQWAAPISTRSPATVKGSCVSPSPSG
ncbi:MAG: hypothetical protein R2856_26505 [Caldilineaceae bacterium]